MLERMELEGAMFLPFLIWYSWELFYLPRTGWLAKGYTHGKAKFSLVLHPILRFSIR
jgi:hypothetical protein